MKNEISSHLVTSRENLAPKNPSRSSLSWSSLNIHDVMMQLRKPHGHLTSICFSVPGSEKSPILLKCSLFSAQISGVSADFHRKWLDIVKQHPNNAGIWADSVF